MSDTPHSGAIRTRSATGRRLASALAVLALAIGVAVTTPAVESASAASHGPGYDQGLGFLGAYSEGGYNVYCLEQPKNPPLNTTATNTGYAAWGTMSADENARVNWAISTYGQSGDRRWTAAVALFVWSLAEPTYNSHGMSGDIYFVGRAPASEQPLIRANLATIRAGAASIHAGTTSGSATGVFAVEHDNNYNGTLTVALNPANMTGSVTLTNGVFLSTGTNTIAGVTNGAVLQVKGVPTPDGEPYKISASGTFTGPFAYGGRVSVWATPGLQTLAGPGPQGAPIANLSAIDPTFRVSDFVPELTSAVSDQTLRPGDVFTDTFTFAAGLNPEAGAVVPWLQYGDGTYAVITATVTLYRALTKPVPGDPIPTDAIPVETFTISTTPGAGPTTPYSWSSPPLADGGYYVAVSTIRSADQALSTQLFIPLDYEWTDGWGVVSETAVLMAPGTSTATPTAIAGLAASDTVYLPDFIPAGAWIEWEVYLRPGGGPDPLESDDTEAIDPAAVCDSSTLYTTLGLEVTGPVMITPDTFTFDSAGVYDWIAVVRDGDGGPELWRAPCGVVSERTVVRQVDIATEAQSSTTHDGPVYDIAIVSGTILEGDELTFRAYRPQFDTAGGPVCADANLLWTSAPVQIDAGVYEGETFSSGTAAAEGTTIWWVEELTHEDGTIVHSGQCGLATETSHRPSPPLAKTGADGDHIALAIWIGAGVAALGAMLLVIAWRRRQIAR